MSGKFRPARKVERFGHGLNEGPGEIEIPVKMQVTRDWTERPHGALLQLGIDLWHVMYRIGGGLGSRDASRCGVAVGIPPFAC